MKKNIMIIMLAALCIASLLTGCTPENDKAVTTETIRVIGTAQKTSSRAVESTGADYELVSVKEVVVNGRDIRKDLVPADPSALKGDKVNNVTFKAEVEVPKNIDYTAEPMKGYVFDEWEVLEAEEEEGKETAKADKKLLDEIEDWLEKDGREKSETLKAVPSSYIKYLVAEYDNGFHITLDARQEGADKGDGTKANPYTVAEFEEEVKKYDEDEISLVIGGSDAEGFAKLMTALGNIKDLEEVKLTANGAELKAVPALPKLEEISLRGFTFTEKVVLDSADAEYKFEDCTFSLGLEVKKAKEIEISGGSLGTLTVISAEEVEIENAKADTIDLSAMMSGEIELENVDCKDIRKPAEGSKAEIETEED